MATWIVGDVQGCLEPLHRLLASVGFEPGRDLLVGVGDLVNRGPASAAALRYFAQGGSSTRSVLGNHDVHLLGVSAGVVELRRGDTLDEVLAAPDREALLGWLRACPLALELPGVTVVHAGVPPGWTPTTLAARAREAEGLMQGPGAAALLAAARTADAAQDCADGPPLLRAASTVSLLTRIRVCDRDGRVDHRFKQAPEDGGDERIPWYAHPARAPWPSRIAFGHWAALGQRRGTDWISLDSGCVWGERLTAWNPGTDEVVSVPASIPPS